jgi:hypothetical protein
MFLTILFCFVCFEVFAQSNRITATLTLTNAPTTNGMGYSVNGGTSRYFTNVVVNSALTFSTNTTIGGSTTNLFNQAIANPYSGPVIVAMPTTNTVTFVGPIGASLTVTTNNGNWGTVSYSTQVVTRVIDVRVPISAEAAATNRTNIASLLTQGISDYSTTAVARTAIALSNFGGLLSTQTWAGDNLWTGSNRFSGQMLATNWTNRFTGDGSGLSNLPASNLTGTIADARHSTNIPWLNGTNVFLGTNSFTNSTWNNGALLSVTLTVSNSLFVQTNLGIHQTAIIMGSTNIDWSLGNVFIKTNLSNATLTFSGQSEKEIVVLITNGGFFTVTWPTVVWQNGVTPVQTTNKTDLYLILKAGAQFIGRHVTNFATPAF